MNLILKNNFYISRHAIAENNDLWIESCNIENQKKYWLTKLWIEKLKQEAEKYKNSFDFIICSPFRRTQETALEYSKTNWDCEIIIDEKLVDINVGIYDERPYYESQKFEDENDIINNRFPKWENYIDVQKRMLKVIEKYNKSFIWKNILIVSHGWALQTIIDTFKYWELKKQLTLIDKSTVLYLNDLKR
jgi:broad specificity phosphatase PhoE